MPEQEIDFTFLDSAGRPWRVKTRQGETEHIKARVFIYYWSTYDRWIPLREATQSDIKLAQDNSLFKPMPPWEADLYHTLSRSHE